MSGSGKNEKSISLEMLKLYAEGLVTPKQAEAIAAHLAINETDRLILEGILAEKADLTAEIESVAASFENVFKESDSSQDKRSNGSGGGIRLLWPILATAAALLVFFIAVPLLGHRSASEIVEAELKEPYVLQTFAGQEQIELDAAEAYRANDFETAYDLFGSLDLVSSEPAYYYMGLSALYQKEYSRAQEIFSAVSKTESPYSRHAIWFEGLAYFKLGEEAEARRVLGKLNAKDFKYALAQKLLK